MVELVCVSEDVAVANNHLKLLLFRAVMFSYVDTIRSQTLGCLDGMRLKRNLGL